MRGPMTYWKSIRDENTQARTHTQRHMNVWNMFGMRWSHALFLWPLTALFFSLVHTKTMGYVLSFFGPTLWPYSNLIVFHASFITFLSTMSNLMLYLLHSPQLYVLHSHPNIHFVNFTFSQITYNKHNMTNRTQPPTSTTHTLNSP